MTKGRAVSLLIVAGWALTVLLAALQGSHAGRDAWVLAAVGALSGATWATKRYEDDADGSLQVLLIAASLQATAATIAFDRGAIAAWPFVVLLALAAGQVGRTRAEVLGQAGVLAVGQLLVAALAPDRAATAAEAALVLAPSILLLALAGAGWRELREARAGAAALPSRLRAIAAADPARATSLAGKVHGLDAERVAGALAPLAADERTAAAADRQSTRRLGDGALTR